MIKINLGLRKQAASSSRSATNIDIEKSTSLLKMDVADLADLPWKKWLIVGGFLYAANWFIEDEKIKQINILQAKIDEVNAEVSKLQGDLGRIQNLEQSKAELDREELVVRQKIQILETLLGNRQVPTQFLIGLAKSIPESVWLSNFSFSTQEVRLTGNSISFSAVSDFIRLLGEGPYLADLKLEGTNTEKDPKGFEVTTFNVSGKRKGMQDKNGTN